MASKRRNTTQVVLHKRRELLQDRLHLIKRRHRELILKPREDWLEGFLDDEDDPFRSLDEADEMQILDSYDLQGQF